MPDRVSRGLIISLLAGLPIAAVASPGVNENGGKSDSTKPAKSDGYVGHPGKNGAKCSTCGLFMAPNHCNVIPGIVSPNGHCNLYLAKKK